MDGGRDKLIYINECAPAEEIRLTSFSRYSSTLPVYKRGLSFDHDAGHLSSWIRKEKTGGSRGNNIILSNKVQGE